ncbi:DUF6571 family protein [Streptomyces sp. NBC_01803]|uniref:DUF6571 family protein n=1 Tax=Streptomyces sp. NBC_01803 TaxID=2975946 RepID=UPI002DD9AD39|nr:DUF6571 family protein [Streptomyces sp. NBC_01803]WSA46791.1 hypothetical protein OIE51_22965 [Streptomyces sp. NBC_01803]
MARSELTTVPTYQEIIEQNFAALDAAATELEAAAEEFGQTADTYRTRVASLPHHDELWVGDSAGAASFRFSQTEGELDAAKAEARSLAGVIRDGRSELLRLRGELEEVAAEIRAEGFGINGDGRVTLNPDWAHDTESDRLERERSAWQGRLDQAVEVVSRADDSLRLALLEVVEGQDGRRAGVFNGGAAASTEEVLADRAEELARRLADGEELSGAELSELNHLLELEADDPQFARSLLEGLGGDGFVSLSARTADQVIGGEGDTRQSFAGLQEHLATALAAGTDVPTLEPGSMEYGQWAQTEEGLFYARFMDELHDAGSAGYAVDSLTQQDVRGYQLLTSLMNTENPDYSQRFLHDLADDIRAAEDPSLGGDEDIWRLRADDLAVDGLDADEQEWFTLDPMDAVLGVMGHQPDVATAYLDPEDGNGRLDYLLDERDWSQLNMPMGTSMVSVPGDMTGLGAALQAATTGVPADQSPTITGLNPTEAGGRIVHEVVEKFSADEGTLIADDGKFATLRPELARMTAAYMGDFQMGISQLTIREESEGFTNLTDLALDDFLGQLGRDAEAHGIVTGAQQAYTALAVDIAINQPREDGISLDGLIESAVSPGAQMAGIMSDARAGAVYDAGIAGAEEYNSRLGTIQEWTGVVLDEAVGLAAERYPLAGPVIEWGVGELSDSIFETLQRDNSEQAAQDAGDTYDEGYQAAIGAAQHAVDLATEGHYAEDSDAPTQLKNAATRTVTAFFGTLIGWDAPEAPQQ